MRTLMYATVGVLATVWLLGLFITQVLLVLVAVAAVVAGVAVLVKADGRTRRNWLSAARIQLAWPLTSSALRMTTVTPRNRMPFYRVLARRRRGVYVRRPYAVVTADRYGVKMRLWTIPGITRKSVSALAPELASAWRCHRVNVYETQPGHLLIRGLKYDPLKETVRIPTDDGDIRQLRIGLDEWGQEVTADLAQIPGVTIGGLPGKGKTTTCMHWLLQLGKLKNVQLMVIDGKGGGDYEAWKDRSWRYVQDDLTRTRDALREAYELMRLRQETVHELLKTRDAWTVPMADWFPLVVVVVDECQTLFTVKGHDREIAEQCSYYVEQLIRRGRSVMFMTLLLTQKQTHDAIPTSIRDNCEWGLCFPVRTSEAAVAALGEDIRMFPDLNPALLQGEGYVGVATMNSPKLGGYVRVKCPIVVDAETEAAKTADLRRNPMKLLKDELKLRGVTLDGTVVPLRKRTS